MCLMRKMPVQFEIPSQYERSFRGSLNLPGRIASWQEPNLQHKKRYGIEFEPEQGLMREPKIQARKKSDSKMVHGPAIEPPLQSKKKYGSVSPARKNDLIRDSREPPMQHRKRPISGVRESVLGTDLTPAECNNGIDYVLLGDQSKFANNIRYRVRSKSNPPKEEDIQYKARDWKHIDDSQDDKGHEKQKVSKTSSSDIEIVPSKGEERDMRGHTRGRSSSPSRRDKGHVQESRSRKDQVKEDEYESKDDKSKERLFARKNEIHSYKEGKHSPSYHHSGSEKELRHLSPSRRDYNEFDERLWAKQANKPRNKSREKYVRSRERSDPPKVNIDTGKPVRKSEQLALVNDAAASPTAKPIFNPSGNAPHHSIDGEKRAVNGNSHKLRNKSLRNNQLDDRVPSDLKKRLEKEQMDDNKQEEGVNVRNRKDRSERAERFDAYEHENKKLALTKKQFLENEASIAKQLKKQSDNERESRKYKVDDTLIEKQDISYKSHHGARKLDEQIPSEINKNDRKIRADESERAFKYEGERRLGRQDMDMLKMKYKREKQNHFDIHPFGERKLDIPSHAVKYQGHKLAEFREEEGRGEDRRLQVGVGSGVGHETKDDGDLTKGARNEIKRDVDYAIKYRAGLVPTPGVSFSQPVKRNSEYQLQYQWKHANKESPLVDAEMIVYKNHPDMTSVSAGRVASSSEYRAQFKQWTPDTVDSDRDEESKVQNKPRRERNVIKRSKSLKEMSTSKHTGKSEGDFISKDFVHRSLNTDDIPMKHSHNSRRRYKSEYASNFQPPWMFKSASGAWKLDQRSLKLDRDKESMSDVCPSSEVRPQPASARWYDEVLELRRSADEYRRRARGSHFSHDHLAQLYARNTRLWEEAVSNGGSSVRNKDEDKVEASRKENKQSGNIETRREDRDSDDGAMSSNESEVSIFRSIESRDQRGGQHLNTRPREDAVVKHNVSQSSGLTKNRATDPISICGGVRTEVDEVLLDSNHNRRALNTYPNQKVVDKGSGQSTDNMAQGQEVKTNKDVVQLKKATSTTYPLVTHGVPTRDTHILIDNHGRPAAGLPPSRPPTGGALGMTSHIGRSGQASQLKENRRDDKETQTREDKQVYMQPYKQASDAEQYQRTERISEPASVRTTARSGDIQMSYDTSADILSTSARSTASSCSLASEVLARARSRRNEFWSRP